MHLSAMENAKLFFDVYGKYFADGKNLRVVEIGSQDLNGSLRSLAPVGAEYLGVDFVAGRGVDVILDDPYKLPFPDEYCDIVVCSSVFEHSEFFWLLFEEILRILKPTGLFYLNAPSNGHFHRHQVDCWRFYPDAAHALMRWAQRQGYHPAVLESFVSRQSA